MPSVSGFVGWFFANVSVPLLAPVAVLPMVTLARTYRRAGGGLMVRAIQDGQLFWTVIAMCASACHELARAMSEGLDGFASSVAWAAMVVHVFFIVLSSVLVTLGAIDTLHDDREPSGRQAGDRRLMKVSLAVTAVTAATFSWVHYALAD